MFRDLVVHVDSSDGALFGVRFAVDIARRLEARLTGMHVTPQADLAPIFKASQVAGASARLASRLALGAEAAAALFHAEATSKLTNTGWFTADGDVAKAISAAARYADLVIIGQGDWQDPVEAHLLPVAHSVTLQCGRPVLVVPATTRAGSFPKVVVAWDGSREAVRAIHDALPLLQLARSTTILSVQGALARTPTLDMPSLIDHLARHGVSAEADEQQTTVVREHAQLRHSIEQGGYDLLVMGAYSHSRWLEFIFGGATNSILLTSLIPVLVSH